jgi:hypothetical protein
VSNSLPLQNWVSVAISADGTKLAAAARGTQGANLSYFGPIYTSANGGLNWSSNMLPSQIWSAIAASADGRTLAAVALNGPVYGSTNFGTTWFPSSVPGITTNWLAVASTADAGMWLASVYGGGIYSSTNHGNTWVSNAAPALNWTGLTLSADGNKMASVIYKGGIYSAYANPVAKLGLSRSGTNLNFSWTVPATNFSLQQNSNLASATWSTVTNTPVLNLTNLQNQVSLPLPAVNAFYRLKTP